MAELGRQTRSCSLCHRTNGRWILAAAFLWMTACLVATGFAEEGSYVMSRVWLLSALVLPAGFAVGGAMVQKPKIGVAHTSVIVGSMLWLANLLCLAFAYALCAAAIDEMHRVWSRISYEGGTSMDLRSAEYLALYFALLASTVYGLRHWPASVTGVNFFNRAAIALLIATSVLSALFLACLGHWIEWRG